MKISFIIPIYDKLPLTIQCIESIARFSFYFQESEVVIIDDGSDEDTARYFADFTQENVWLIYHRNDANLKFAGSCNAGATLARGEFLIFLNNDTVVTENWDKFLLNSIEADRDTWMVGAKLLFPNGTLQHAGVYLPELTGRSFGHVYRGFPSYFPPANFEKKLQCVTAACMIMRRTDFLHLGGFDTGFLNGSEDIDLCLRIIGLGKKIMYQPKCEVIHHESQSEGRLNYSRQNAERLSERWKDRARPDFRERVNQDIRKCIGLGLMSEICQYGPEKGWTSFMKINPDLKINENGNPERILLKDPVPVQIPLNQKKVEDDLFIWLECNVSESTSVRLQYKIIPGHDEKNQHSMQQHLRTGFNQVLLNISTPIPSDRLEVIFTGKKSTIEFLSLSIYTYGKKLSARNPSLFGKACKMIMRLFRI